MTKQTSAQPFADAQGPSLRQRAARARDAAGRFIRRGGQVTDQPEPASLPRDSGADRRADTFSAAGATPHDAGRGHPDDGGRADAAPGSAPRPGQTMGRHETFENAAPIADELLASTVRAARDAAAPRGRVPAPINTHPDAYGLEVWEEGFGLHAAPGSSVIVEPVMPNGAGLAVFYFNDRPAPTVLDLTHNFNPVYARPPTPGSEVMPLIEVVDPATGRVGRVRADRIEKIHRVTGVYTPAEIAEKHLPAPTPLPMMTECPEGMGTHRVEDAAAYPLVRPGETIVYDGMQREPTNGALCVLQWSRGRRSVLLTNLRTMGGTGEPHWFVDPVNRPSSREMMDRRLKAGTVGMLFASDGPYTEDLLREKILGTVVGVLVPHRQEISPPIARLEPHSADPVKAIRDAATRRRESAAAVAINDASLMSRVSGPVRDAITGHCDVMVETEQDDDDSDETFDLRANMQIEAENAVAQAPVRTLADVRAKLTYLVPIIAPDMGDLMHVEHLEAITADVDRLCREPARGADQDEAVDPIFTAIRAHTSARSVLGKTTNEQDEPWRRERGLDTSDEAMMAAEAAHEAASTAEVETWNAVFSTRPATLAGVAAAARHAQAWAQENDGMVGAIDLSEILGGIATDIERLADGG